MNPIRGECLCEAIAFELTPPTDFCGHCHCASCRKSHGAAFVTWTSVPRERFRIVRGEESVHWYRSSLWIFWGSCRRCGSPMLYRADSEGHRDSPRTDRMYVSVGSLIDPMDRAPDCHVSFEEALPGMDPADGLPRYRGKTRERI